MAWFLVAILLFLWLSERSDRRSYHDDFKVAAFECVNLSDRLAKADKAWVNEHRDLLKALDNTFEHDTIPPHASTLRGTDDDH